MASSLLFRGVATTLVLAAGATAALEVGSVVVPTGGLASCIETSGYVYTAQKYDPANDCVNAYKPVEIVKGGGAGATCPRTCLMVGGDLYVTTMCPPLPDIATAVEDDAGTCIAAMKAAASGGTCDAPAAPAEGGGADDAGAGDDAGGGGDDAAADADGIDAAMVVKDAGDAG